MQRNMNSFRKVFGKSFGSLPLAFPLSPRLGGRRTPLQAHHVALDEVNESKTFSTLGARLFINLYTMWLLYAL